MSKETRTTSSRASRDAYRLKMQLVSGGGPGTIRKWSNGAWELKFVPDNAYTEDGYQYLKRIPRESHK